MSFAVTWSVAATIELSRLLASADDPERIRQAADWIDYNLRRHPADLGESRAISGERVWYGDVLAVCYSVNADDQTVRVISIGPAQRRWSRRAGVPVAIAGLA